MAHIDELRPDDFAEATGLIDRCMRPGSDLSMSEDFPLLVGPAAAARRLVVRSGGRIVSHVASRLAAVQLPNGALIRIANIGAVCTDESATGQGFAGRLLEEQLRLATEEGVEMAMLWSEADGFYERHGFEKAGMEARFLVSQADLRGIDPIACRWAESADLTALLKLRAEDPCRVSRTHADAGALFNLPRSKTLVATQGEFIVAYVTLGKGLDFEGAICEWGGDITDVVRMLPVLLAGEGLESVLILGPGWHDAYLRTFRALACPFEMGELGMFRVLNHATMIQAVDSPEYRKSLLRKQPALSRLIGSCEETTNRPVLPFYVWGLDSM